MPAWSKVVMKKLETFQKNPGEQSGQTPGGNKANDAWGFSEK